MVSLRMRLVLATFTVGVVFALLSRYLHEAKHTRLTEEAVSQVALLPMHTSGRLKCKADPAGWGGVWGGEASIDDGNAVVRL